MGFDSERIARQNDGRDCEQDDQDHGGGERWVITEGIQYSRIIWQTGFGGGKLIPGHFGWGRPGDGWVMVHK